jgi:hypothetical protein
MGQALPIAFRCGGLALNAEAAACACWLLYTGSRAFPADASLICVVAAACTGSATMLGYARIEVEHRMNGGARANPTYVNSGSGPA